MPDLDLPPDSPLPDGVRAAALTRLRAGLDAPPPRRLPLKVAAIAVAAVTATTLAVQLTGREDSTSATSSTAREVPELPLQDASAWYDLRTGSAPDGAEQRCRARSNGLPPAQRWTPIATASRHRVDLTAFRTSAGTVFCETTPMSVTVSSPQADPGALAVAFTTATGSMAGFTGTDPRSFRLVPRTDEQRGGAVVARVDRVFLMPNGLVSEGVFAQPEVATSAELVQRFELATPPPSGTVVDRPVAVEDAHRPEDHRPAECLADQSPPVPDAAAWRAGQAAALTATESVRLGHYQDLLALCREDGTVTVHDFRRAGAPRSAGTFVTGTTLRGVRMFYGFGEVTRGDTTYRASNTEALVAEITDVRVATVTLVGPGQAGITVGPVAGSVVVPGLRSDDREVRIVVKDASGTVLEELPLA
ncbi:hypothetical protein [Saccharothrix stipae]